jgi:UDP-4-amino-4,6-dideoxy-L-N-acetyl-beta-L-altrosamine transaminase
MKYYNKQHIVKEDIKNVVKALRSERITQGKFVTEFENKLRNYFGAKYALTVSNATSAFYLLSQYLKWKKNDFIILSPISFVAAANSVLKSGATPVFVDINLSNQNLDPKLVERKILALKKKKKKVSAVIVTDYAGKPANWKEFKKIKVKYNVKLINDNCHALGAKYFGSSKYAIKFADYVIQSYHAVKNITTAEGGSILTNDKKSYNILKNLREHGFLSNQKKGPFNYNINEVGYNFRLSDLNCALGASQIKRINIIRIERNKLAKVYDKIFFHNDKIRYPLREKNIFSAYHLYNIRINFEDLKINKINFYNILKKKYNINLQVHYTPTYKFNVFKKIVPKSEKYKNSEKYYKETFSLPLHLGLKEKDVYSIGKKITHLVNKNSKNKIIK